jgi:hypothetical protein
MSCRNICYTYRVKKSHQGSYHKDGLRRCTECEIFMRCNGTRCPCCNASLRTKTHDTKIRRFKVNYYL